MKILFLGDSITQGIGSKLINYVPFYQEKLPNAAQHTICNLALTGTCISHIDKILQKITAFDADMIVMMYGNVDAQIKPNRNGKAFRHFPAYYRNNPANIFPRPVYSHHLFKRICNISDNEFRKLLRRILIRCDGTTQDNPIERFTKQYETYVKMFTSMGKTVVICSCLFVDERLFPDSNAQYKLYNDVLKKLSADYGTLYCDYYTLFSDLVANNGFADYYLKVTSKNSHTPCKTPPNVI